RTRSWEKDGTKHRLTEVDADEFLLLDSVNKASEPSLADDAGSQANWAQTYPEPDF
ncbi:single-stranded DNA-binding protein, partial [Vibrio cholerae]